MDWDMKLKLILIVLSALFFFEGGGHSSLVGLSDKMIADTATEHHVSRKVAMRRTWERDMFINDLPNWILDSDQIVIVEQRFSWVNPSVQFFALNLDCNDVYTKRVPFVKSAISKRQYKRRVKERMQSCSLEADKISALRHLAQVAFSKADASNLYALFEPNVSLDSHPSYYVWLVQRTEGVYYTLYYHYVGECLRLNGYGHEIMN